MSATSDDPGFVPEGYRIVQKLGAGQTSNVYAATHPEFSRVALKLPRPELQSRPVLRRMFENEVQITVKLSHPNIVAAYDGFPTGERAFLALEYCAGGTLDQLLLEKGKLPLATSFRLIVDVGEGLAHTHRRSVLHRDVKPANVFIAADGSAKLGDFGTGMFLAEDSTDRVGTAFYMAPEIFEGARASQRSDIYSLGVLAYEVIAGERPFVGDTYDGLMLAHLSGIPKDLHVFRPDLSRNVTRVVTRAMSRDPERRFASVGEFVTAFRAASGLKENETGRELSTEERAVTGRASRAPRAPTPNPGPTRRGAQKSAGERDKRAGRDDDGDSSERGGLFGWLKRRKD